MQITKDDQRDDKICVRDAIHRSIKHLSSAERRLADYTLNNYSECALLNISDFAKACKVSTATVNRYARSIGFEGYHKYRNALKYEATSLSSRTIFEESIKKNPSDHPRDTSLSRDIGNLRALEGTLNKEDFDKTAKAIMSARKVLILGQGSSTYIAGYFTFNLQGLGIDARELSNASGIEGMARSMLHVEKRDLFIPVAFPRFTKLTMELTALAKQKECPIHSLTSTIDTPLAALSDVTLLAPPRVELHSGSAVTSMAVIEALLFALSKKAKTAVTAAEILGNVIDDHVL